jgi:Mitochondrial carrier protein
MKTILTKEGIGGFYKGKVPDNISSHNLPIQSSSSPHNHVFISKGLAAPFFAQTLINALVFTGDTMAIRMIEPSLKPHELPSLKAGFAAGFMGGILQCLVLVPTDNIKCRLQVQTKIRPATFLSPSSSGNSFTGVFDVIQQIYRKDSIFGLFRGGSITHSVHINNRTVLAFSSSFSVARFFHLSICHYA